MSTVTIKAADGGSFSAYVATPSAATAPGLLVIQEIFGVNQVMRDLCDAFAAQGYLAVCPDLFWRQEPGIDITDQSEAEWNKAFSLYQGFDEDLGVEDLKATLAFLREHPETTDKAGTVGYCLGGKLAYLMATRSDVDCAVAFYGVGIEKALDEAAGIQTPLMLQIAEKDQFCPPEAQTAIKDALGGHAHVTIHSYAGVDHAFARPGGAHYDAAAATLANQRRDTFFKDHLA